MAGIKNLYQYYGATPFDKIQGKTIFDRHAQTKLREYTPYCKFCGGEIVDAGQDENGHAVDPEWERINKSHYRCYRKNFGH
ncbi:hypothetical protein MOF23_07690 [Bacillus inaquosorum]|uniref:hypothetical protein n=1 Tax=Bacillus inaquosorum TaxID=483913 RepID=UPI0022800996|nr:hypothetical protein [Bacillus inaquosorum]MCY9308851.1 hypothetical protein [Bacillus inaquosorum]